jgi:hypothetical protein
VAALTMPSLVANYQKNVTLTRLKKFYSIQMQSANLLSVDETQRPEPVASSLNNPDFAVAMLEYRYAPYVKNLDIKKRSRGAVMTFPDGSGVYMRKSSFEAVNPTWHEHYFFCVEVKKCMELDETKTVDYITDGRSTFVFDSGAPGYYGQLKTLTRDAFKTGFCNGTKPGGCASLIIGDSWEIAPDYPW